MLCLCSLLYVKAFPFIFSLTIDRSFPHPLGLNKYRYQWKPYSPVLRLVYQRCPQIARHRNNLYISGCESDRQRQREWAKSINLQYRANDGIANLHWRVKIFKREGHSEKSIADSLYTFSNLNGLLRHIRSEIYNFSVSSRFNTSHVSLQQDSSLQFSKTERNSLFDN